MNKQECIKECVFANGVIKLPEVQLDRKAYVEVKKAFEAIGAKWKGGKTQGFILNDDKAELFSRIQNDPDYNYLKDTKFFETPPEICQLIKEEIKAIYQPHDLQYMQILEPSAGHGALIDVICGINEIVQVRYCETDSYNQKKLKDLTLNMDFLCSDFMELDLLEFDLIVANPPFNRGLAQKHLLKMINHLKEGYGTIICVMPLGWDQGRHKKTFNFLYVGNFTVYEIDCPPKAFKNTNISTTIVVIQSHKE